MAVVGSSSDRILGTSKSKPVSANVMLIYTPKHGGRMAAKPWCQTFHGRLGLLLTVVR